MSWSVAKLALPMTRLSIIRPATVTRTGRPSSSSLVAAPCVRCRSAARCARQKSLGKATPRARNSASFPRRSAVSSRPGWSSASLLIPRPSSGGGSRADAALEACGDEVVEVAVEHRLGVPLLDPGAQILDPRLVEHVRTDLVTPADVGLLVLERLLRFVALAQLLLVELRLEHRHRLGAVAVLRAVVLALHDDAARNVRDPHRRVGAVDVLAAGAGGPVGIDAEVRRIHLDRDRLVDLRVHEHARERGVPTRVRIERRLADEAMNPGLGPEAAVGVVAGDLERGGLDPGDLAVGLLEDLDGEALALGVLHVHALEHLRPVLGLGAAGAGLDVEEAVVRV